MVSWRKMINKYHGYDYLVADVEDADSPEQESTLVVIDGNITFYQKDLPNTFKKVSTKLFDTLHVREVDHHWREHETTFRLECLSNQ